MHIKETNLVIPIVYWIEMQINDLGVSFLLEFVCEPLDCMDYALYNI